MVEAAVGEVLAAVYRDESRRVLATLIRMLGGFDEAEEALHDAFTAAAEQWPKEGVPDNPTAWLVSTGRFRTISRWRRRSRLTNALPELAVLADSMVEPPTQTELHDDQLRLIFTCCHPALLPDARAALTLREVAGLTTEQIARAYMVSTPTIAQRIVRAKAKIRADAIPYEVPERAGLPVRVESALQVVYLIFNEGYAATDGPDLARADLCLEATRLARLLVDLLGDPEALGLLALVLLHEARRATRIDSRGDVVLLADQDRSLWNWSLIDEARSLIDRSLRAKQVGSYTLQAAIAAAHVGASPASDTDWNEVVALYDVLLRVDPTPVGSLNRAVALGMRDGFPAGLLAIEEMMRTGELDEYHLAHAARADMQRRLGKNGEARASYLRALSLARQPAEKRFLERRLEEVSSALGFSDKSS